MDQQKIKAKLISLIKEADEVKKYKNSVGGGTPIVDTELFSSFKSGALSFLANVFGENHTYHKIIFYRVGIFYKPCITAPHQNQ